MLFVAIASLAVVAYSLEATYGRSVLKHHLRDEGWTLTRARWRPSIPLRRVRFDIEAVNGSRRAMGTAYLGGDFTGPVLSRRVEIEWHDESRSAPAP